MGHLAVVTRRLARCSRPKVKGSVQQVAGMRARTARIPERIRRTELVRGRRVWVGHVVPLSSLILVSTMP